ncbi:MAG: helix-turn-helix domain-containing protein [Candidatus Eisenbacteria bacterium]
MILCRGGLVTRAHLPMAIADRPRETLSTAPSIASDGDDVALGEMERELLVKAMAKAEQNKSRAAKLLGVSRGQLSLLRRHGLTDARR